MTEVSPRPRELIGTTQASLILGCAINTVLAYVCQGKLRCYRPGNSRKFYRDEVVALLHGSADQAEAA